MADSRRRARLLLVDDDEAACRLLAEVLERDAYEVVTSLSVDDAVRALDTPGRFDAVLTDLRMPDRSGLDLLRLVREREPDAVVIVLTAFGDAAMAGEAIRAGAYDFVSKPYDIASLRTTLGRALERRRLSSAQRERPAAAGPAVPGAERIPLVGHSPAIIDIMKTVARVASSRATVLVTGETGTGKELIARTLHQYSDRRDRRFVAVNCAALPEGLLESELFGHVRGAFTGAAGVRAGLFREADHGTLFLDEIGDITPPLQSRLLRALQEHQIVPVGADTPVAVDVRIIAATHRDLATLVREGTLREDLFYRLNVVTLHLPPLRERRQDIPLLIDHSLRTLGARHGRAFVAVDSAAQALLLDYDWPGNVRELQNALERSLVLAEQDVIGPEHLPAEVRASTGHRPGPSAPATPGAADDRFLPLAELERLHVIEALERCGGNRERAARLLGISRRTLTRMVQRWGLPRRQDWRPSASGEPATEAERVLEEVARQDEDHEEHRARHG